MARPITFATTVLYAKIFDIEQQDFDTNGRVENFEFGYINLDWWCSVSAHRGNICRVRLHFRKRDRERPAPTIQSIFDFCFLHYWYNVLGLVCMRSREEDEIL